uniref:Structural maintenance of chromosomes protein 3 n=1 Tax=Anopheles atroparvus TaxID=41427 RepID=A0A182J0E3_ANOAO
LLKRAANKQKHSDTGTSATDSFSPIYLIFGNCSNNSTTFSHRILKAMQKGRDGKSTDLLEQFTPLDEADLAIHAKKIEEVKTWLVAAQRLDPAYQILLITGPSGSGKRICVHTIARQLKYDVIEWSTPVDVDLFFDDNYDFDNREEKQTRRPQKALFDNFLYKSSRYCSLFSATPENGRLLVVNDFPNSMLRKPEEFHDSLERFRESSTSPIVFIASDASSKALDIAFNLFPPAIMETFQIHTIKFNSVSVTLLKKAIKRITSIIRNDKDLSKIYQAAPSKPVEENIIASAQGDLRNCCLNFLFASMKGVSSPQTGTKNRSLFLSDSKKNSNNLDAGEGGSGLGLSENLSTMHGLGRIFHPKFVKGSGDAKFLHTPETIADCFVSQPTGMLSLLHSNYVNRCSNVQNLAAASENLTLVDVITNEYRSDQLPLLGLNIAIRGIMVNNEHTAHGWQQIKKKISVQFRPSTKAYCEDLQQRGVITRPIPSKMFATEYKGYITIAGFKSYRQKTIIEQLDKRHNIVVGRNGSGKSNFFSAIEFVLSNEYNNLRLEQRKGLISQIKGSIEVASAFVEIVFDNGDSQIPIEGKEFRIRRTITQSKDQYTIDGKNATRKEVVQFLEMAGLSNSNPYYIVKQGKINELATARPAQLLQVLFEVSGIRIYNEQRESILNKLKQTEVELKPVLESRDILEKEVETLQQEVGELQRYEQLDKKRRVLEFVILDKDKTNISNELETLGQARDNLKEKHRMLAKQKAETQHHVASVRKELKQVQVMLVKAIEQKSTLPKQHHRLVKIKTGLELKVEDLEKELISESQRLTQLESQLDKMNKKIEEEEAKLQDCRKRCVELHQQEDNVTGELRKKDQQRSEYLDKQRRGMQFATRVERDRWLNEELAALKTQIQESASNMVQLEHQIQKGKERTVVQQDYIAEHSKLCQKMSEKTENYKLRLGELKTNRDDYLLHQRNSWEKESRLQQQLTKERDDLLKLEQTLKKRTSVSQFVGCESVRKVIAAFRSLGPNKRYIVDGYYGQVIENFQCDENIYQAVATVAGNKLFYHVVESDAVAKEIVNAFNKQRLPGTFEFMPLNRLQKRTYKYPTENHAIPLISLLKYDKKQELAIQSVFGRTLLCSDLDAMPKSALQSGLLCVTHDGDQILHGVLKGGYHAPKTPILELHRHINCARESGTSLEEELQNIHADLQQTESNIDRCEAAISQVEGKLQRLLPTFEKERNKLRLLPELMRQNSEVCETLERKLRMYKNDHEIMKCREIALLAEMDLELTDKLTVEDQRAIELLDGEIRQLRQQQQQIFNSALEADQVKAKLENMLNSNLLPKRDELYRSIEASNREVRSNEMEGYRKQIDDIVAKIAVLLEETNKLEQNIATITQQKETIDKALKTWLQKLQKIEEEIAVISPDLPSHDTLRKTLEKRKEDVLSKINDLGALPAVDPVYFSMPPHKLMGLLEQSKKQLKRVSNCNQKAQDEYTRQLKKLSETDKHIQELRTVKETVYSSLQTLDIRREQGIEDTFRNVNQNFQDIFRRFVPSGKAHLILHTKNIHINTNDCVITGDDTNNRYLGLGMEVSFVGDAAIMSEINQLSGGQKTLVAIALILAIQQYKPASFYLFDEIDQALDNNYRERLADLIHELSNSSQFITTTFRRELLKHANKCYGVRCRNKISHIDEVTKKQAYDFVIDDNVNN